MLLVRVLLGRPVFFCQERIGFRGKNFHLIKFRTMTDARDPATGELLPDSRRTPAFGRFLRASSLDELPQLLNVIKGDMALVGPRPLDAATRDRFTQEAFHRHDVRPGITGWAQIHGRNNLTWNNRIRLDLWYVRNRSFLVDLKILLKTTSVVLGAMGINAGGERQAPGSPGEGKHPAIAGISVPPPSPDALHGHIADAPDRPQSFLHRLLVVSVHLLWDAAVLFFAFYISYQFRLDFSYHGTSVFLHFLPHSSICVAITLGFLALFGAYAGVWRHFGLRDIPRIAIAFTISAGVILLWRHTATMTPGPGSAHLLSAPAYSVIAMYAIFGFWGCLGIRLFRRHCHERYLARLSARPIGRNLLVVGTSASAVQMAKAAACLGDNVVGFLTSNPMEVGAQLSTFPVLGTLEQWSPIAFSEHVDDIIAVISDIADPATRAQLEKMHRLLHAGTPEADAILETLSSLPSPRAQ